MVNCLWRPATSCHQTQGTGRGRDQTFVAGRIWKNVEKPFAASAIGVKMNLFISKPFTFFTGKEDTKNKALPPTSHKLNHQHTWWLEGSEHTHLTLHIFCLNLTNIHDFHDKFWRVERKKFCKCWQKEHSLFFLSVQEFKENIPRVRLLLSVNQGSSILTLILWYDEYSFFESEHLSMKIFACKGPNFRWRQLV